MNKPKVKQISETLFEVLSHSVKIQKRSGRTLLLCDCQNHSRFCNENPFCYHKQLVLEHINLQPIKKAIKELTLFWDGQKNIKVENAELFLDDLNKLNRILK